MTDSVDRRSVLKGVALSAAALSPIGEALAAEPQGLQFEPPAPFSYELFKQQARERVRAPYEPPPRPSPEVLQKINYEEWGKIRFRNSYALFANGPGPFPVTFFHLGLFFQKAVGMHVVEGDQSRKIIYEQAYFDMPANSPAHQLPAGAGFAGIRIQESRTGELDWHKNDWVAFLGAAYFRAIGELHQYGLSARGIALDVAVDDRPEEFPDFTEFYINSAARRGYADPLRPDGGPLDRGGVQVFDDAHQGRHHGHRGQSLHPRPGLPLRDRARHIHVLVLRDQEADRNRLASRGP